MCGRFYIASVGEMEKISASAQAESDSDIQVKTSGEIFPGDIVPVLISPKAGDFQSCSSAGRDIEDCRLTAKPMIWGFPKWDGKGLIFNARSEGALEKTIFRQSLLERRAAVPTSGFFEWTPRPGQKKKDRYLFTRHGEEILFLAGFWNSFNEPLSGPIPERFTILTTEANESMSRYHNRMPVILTWSEVDDWLCGDDFQKYLDRVQASVKT